MTKIPWHRPRSIRSTFLTLAILPAICSVLPQAAAAQSNTPNAAQAKIDADLEGRIRTGRDLIDRQEWARASEEFRGAIERYPGHRSADAALYWLAFCYRKEKKFESADAALDRLLRDFPSSLWAGDAKVMKVEIAPSLRRRSDPCDADATGNQKPAQGQFSSDLPRKGGAQCTSKAGQNLSLQEELALGQRLPLDRADEIRLAAFQSLLAADPRQAIEAMGKLLRDESQTRQSFKREILRVWRRPRLFASRGKEGSVALPIDEKEVVSLLRETLKSTFQGEKDLRMRIEIVYTLASLADTESLEYLKRLYETGSGRDLKKEIVNAIASLTGGVYSVAADAGRKSKLTAISSLDQDRLGFLIGLIRHEKDVEFQRLAFSNLRRFPKWWTGAGALDAIAGFYDGETTEDVKLEVIRSLSETNQPDAMKKLLDIARNDPSDNLRLEAIYFLKSSKDPSVLKALEELIN